MATSNGLGLKGKVAIVTGRISRIVNISCKYKKIEIFGTDFMCIPVDLYSNFVGF